MAYNLSQTFSPTYIQWIGLLKPEFKLAPDINHSGGPLSLTVQLASRLDSSQPSLEDVRALASSWINEFLSDYAPAGSAVALDVAGYNRIRLRANSEDAVSALISYLQDENEVHYIQRDHYFTHSNAWAHNVVQQGLEALPDYANEVGLIMWNYNLRGYNQTIGIADSGVDYRSCFFADQLSATPTPPNFATWTANPTSTQLAASVTRSKRKIVQYVVFADNNDENPSFDGHGTHTSGTLVGYPVVDNVVSYKQFAGTGTHAQLAFFDIGPNTTANLALPSNLVTGLFNWAYAAGARIHSNSWGSTTNTYTTEAADIDSFMNSNKDMLVLVAAGNSGSCSTSLGTVGSPSTAKNCLTVGASLNSAASWAYFTTDQTYATYGPANFTENSMAYFSSMGPTSDNRLKPDVSAPGYYLTSAKNGQVNGSTCDSANLNNNLNTLAGTSMATPTLAGHVSMMREYFQQGFYPNGKRTPANSFNCSASLLKAMAIAGSVIMNGVKISYGNDANGNQCSVQGPVALKGSPYYDQGYGRFQMNQILFFASSVNRYLHLPSLSSSSSAANYWETAIAAGATNTYTYCVYPNATVPVSVVLVWTDPASTTNAAANLVNNLDLLVTYNGQTVAGNSQSAYFTAAGLTTTDTLNPVEVVSFSGNSGNAAVPMTVSVTCKSLGTGKSQLYSLVISGYVSQGTCSTGPAIAATFLPGSSANSTTLPDSATAAVSSGSTGATAAPSSTPAPSSGSGFPAPAPSSTAVSPSPSDNSPISGGTPSPSTTANTGATSGVQNFIQGVLNGTNKTGIIIVAAAGAAVVALVIFAVFSGRRNRKPAGSKDKKRALLKNNASN
eukprot:TRINITY_DN2667_c1_g1_i3.p1 TRINITY_DN2667_c1_g1~~TRINITY_DN2667_c1_g1_i3.p1  ORF type:complete len:971 (-),score=231.10 TRINITY_DN2667_c1_g1_i3:64-2586(-)